MPAIPPWGDAFYDAEGYSNDPLYVLAPREPECRICSDSHRWLSADGLCGHCEDDIQHTHDAFGVSRSSLRRITIALLVLIWLVVG